jgi:LmbE family N-acetylglucosaminyl deacetylase
VTSDPFRDTGPALVISPHLDDAVFSCGQLIKSRPGSTILTVLAGFPPGAHAGWSGRTTGLPFAKDANDKRRDEDQRAAHLLGARTTWMDLLAQEYGLSADPTERLQGIQEAVATAVAAAKARTIFFPLGVTHLDHIAVSDAVLVAVLGLDVESYIYMDMPYGQARPRRVRRRLRHIRRQCDLEPLAPFLGDLETKAEAVKSYSSQFEELQQGFGRYFTRVFSEPEKYWRIRPFA